MSDWSGWFVNQLLGNRPVLPKNTVDFASMQDTAQPLAFAR